MVSKSTVLCVGIPEAVTCYLKNKSFLWWALISCRFVLFVCVQRQQEPEAPAEVPSWMQGVDTLNEAVAAFSTMEEVMKYLEPDRWQVDMEDLYKPTWQVVGKSFFHQKKSRGKDLVC